MRLLLIKTSSMGDLIHTFPALTDAMNAIPNLVVDWVVEESFVSIPSWHPVVNNVIPVALRRWRKNFLAQQTRHEWKNFRSQMRAQDYDLILDAQGLAKSAFLSYFAKGVRAGLDFRSAREFIAAFAYQKKSTVNFYQHAVTRMRLLFSQTLGYDTPDSEPDFRISRDVISTNNLPSFESSSLNYCSQGRAPALGASCHPWPRRPSNNNSNSSFSKLHEPYLVFLHGTTWTSKQWPENYWQRLAELASQAGYRIKISGGSDEEVARALRLAEKNKMIDAMPRLSISAMAELLANAKAAIAVDTGFGHVAAALGIPTISLYGSTNPEYTGAIGAASIHLATEFSCSPCLKRTCQYRQPSAEKPACYTTLSPERVWHRVMEVLVI